MASATVWIKLAGADKYARLAKRLKAASNGKELQRELRQRIYIEGQVAVRSVRRAAMAVDVQSSGGGGTKSTGLRGRVATATNVSLTARGIRIKVNGRKVDPKWGRDLARYLNNTAPRAWTHPVYGNENVIETQVGQEYFANSIRRHAPRFRAMAVQAMDEIAARIVD